MQGHEFAHEKLTGLQLPDNNRTTNLSLSPTLSHTLSLNSSVLFRSLYLLCSISVLVSPLETDDEDDDAFRVLPSQLFLVDDVDDDEDVGVGVPESIPMIKL